MSIYKYVAISDDGTKNRGSIFVENYEEAYNSLLLRKCIPIQIKQIELSSKNIHIEDMLMFFLHIDLQLKCKTRINDAIESFLNIHGNRVLKLSLEAVLYELKNGSSIGNAFEKCKSIFSNIIISLLKSAEATGNVGGVISSILKFLKMQSNWKNNIKKAVIRPIYITIFIILILAFGIVFLGPQISSLAQSFGDGELPIVTQFVMYVLPITSKMLLCFIISALIFVVLSMLSKKGKDRIMSIILRIPKVGSLITKISFWQFYKIFHIALDAKLNFMQALDLAIENMEINLIKDELLIARSMISEGHSISKSFSGIRFISGAAISAINIGEESNDLSSSFNQLSKNQYTEILMNIESLGQNLGDGIKLFAGVLLILIICGFLLPIYNYIEVAGV